MKSVNKMNNSKLANKQNIEFLKKFYILHM